MGVSILFRYSKGEREEILRIPADIRFIGYFEQEDCWFYLTEEGTSIFRFDSSGNVEEWLETPELKNPYGFCCTKQFIFAMNCDGEVFGYHIVSRGMHRTVGNKARLNILKTMRRDCPRFCMPFSYDQKRDFLFAVFPKTRCIGSIDGMSSFSVEFGGKHNEFSVGSYSDSCGFVNPFSIATTKNGKAIVADKGSHTIWAFTISNATKTNHKLIGVYGKPMKDGQNDGALSIASFSSPSMLFGGENDVFLVDGSGRKLRKIDADKMTVTSLTEVSSEIICLTTDIHKNPCWIERV